MTFYITTAIAYPNGTPHIGHAYEYIAADTLARFHRLDGEDVQFVTGTDEHGLKMQQTAEKEGITPRALADRNAAKFQELQDFLGSSYDRFIRTTDDDHRVASQAIWERMRDNGDIYLDSYAGWYSVRDEAFYQEDETEVVDGERRSVTTGTPVTWTEEESYFFRLSAYQDRLLQLYKDNPEFVGPESRRNEVVSFVAGGLTDLSISRTTFDWGIPVPGDERHVMYVWVDALTNYLTAAGFPDVDSERFQQLWPADLHIIGKDISRFHAVYWPAFLMSAGVEVPKRVHAHGFLFNKGEKMSKSVGNVVDPYDLVDSFGLDTLRYFVLREISYGQDGSYSADGIITRKNTDLANEYGNLAQRSLSMVAKNLDGRMPALTDLTAEDEALIASARALLPAAREHLALQNLHLYLSDAWRVLSATNRYISEQEPWKLKKTDAARMAVVLAVVLEVVRIVTLLVQPVMPESTSRILDLLGVDADARTFASLDTPVAAGTELPAPAPVFPKHVEPAAEDA